MGKGEEEKRQVSPALRLILDLDVILTDKFCKVATKAGLQFSTTQHKALEISCHAVPWLVGWIAFILLFDNPALYQIQVNFLLAFVGDSIVNAVIKAIVRRRRPIKNNDSDMFLPIAPDKYSFPSGHASRASFIPHFFIYIVDIPSIIALPLLLWSAAVCLSRVLLYRHHLLDVISGIGIGIIESMLVSYLWLNHDSCLWLLSIISS